MSIIKMKVFVMNIEDKAVVFFDESAIGGAKGVVQAHYGKHNEVVLVNLDPMEENHDLPLNRFLLSDPKLSLRSHIISKNFSSYSKENFLDDSKGDYNSYKNYKRRIKQCFVYL